MQLGQYQEGHINWFYTKNKSLTIIGGHLGFWQLWWYVNFFRIFHPFCHPQKVMYRGKFCISLIIRSWDKKISIFFFIFFFWGGGGGAVLWIFMRGNFSSYICLSLKKRVVCPLDLNANILKIISCSEWWFLHFPLPQNRYFQKSCAVVEVAVRPNMMEDLLILHFRNPWHNSFLEKYRLHCFTAFCACSSSISLDMCIK